MARGRRGAERDAAGAPAPAATPRKRLRRLRKWAPRLVLAGLVAAVAGVGFLLWYAASVPLPADIVPDQTTTLLASDGQTRLASLNGGVDRVPVRLDQVPPIVQQAVVAAEDRSFYRHSGVDPFGVGRALWQDLRSGAARQGGSTITQQYVKNAYLGRDRTAKRKFREAILAVKLEQKYSKDEILERYLNAIYFGRGAYGVGAASKAWFGKDVSKLGPQEAAYLAAVIRAPESTDVAKNADLALQRRTSVTKAMVITGALTPDQAALIDATPIRGYVVRKEERPPNVTNSDIGTDYWVDVVRRQLVARYGEKVVLGGGLKVTTTLDLDLQRSAYDAVYGTGRQALKPKEPAGALVSVDAEGRVVAMVGGRSFADSQVNLALGRDGGGSGRLAGSTFKPLLLAETVHAGYSVESALPAPPEVVLEGADQGRDYTVANYDHEGFPSNVNLVDATAHSVNTVYAQLAQTIGPDKLVTMAKDLGVTAPLAPNASLVLGTSEVSVLDMASAYSTISRGGERITPRFFTKVVNAEGEVLDAGKPSAQRVLEEDEAKVVTYCLRQVVDRGTGVGARVSGHPVAGKTGTTNDNTDAWFVGYAAPPSRLTTAVWMGWADDGSREMSSVRGRAVNGGGLPAQIWSAFMTDALRGAPAGDFGGKPDLSGDTLKGASRSAVGSDKVPGLPAATTTTSTTLDGASTTSSSLPPGSTTTKVTLLPPGPTTTSTTKASTTTTKPATTTSTAPPPTAPAPTA